MSSSRTATFMEQCLAGDCDPADIDDFIDQWHDGDSDLELHDYLGMTPEEYRLWVEVPRSLPFILASRRFEIPLVDVLQARQREQDLAAAARAGSRDEATQVLTWLRKTGRI